MAGIPANMNSGTSLHWQAENERSGFGPGGVFSDSPVGDARLLLWASSGDRNMGNVHHQYYTAVG